MPGRAPARPGGIPLGVREGAEIAADLAALGGLGLTGPGAPAAARAILAALLSRALPGGPAGPADVIVPAADAAVLLPGWHPGDLAAAVPGLTVTPSLDTALGCAETLLVRRARLPGGDPDEDGTAERPPAALIAAPARPGSRPDPRGPAGRPQRRPGRDHARRLAGRAHLPRRRRRHCRLRRSRPARHPPVHPRHRRRHRRDPPAARSLRHPGRRVPRRAGPGGPPRTWPADTAARETRPAAGSLPRPAPGTADSQHRPATIPAESPPLPDPAARVPHPPAGQAAGPGQDGQTPGPRARRVIRVEVLGPLRITARGQEIRGGLRKARELAAFLAVHPDGATGEAISEALWPEAAPGHGASQRNLALRKLRDLLRAAAGLTEPMLVTLTAGRYRLDPAFITTDVADFQAALHRPATPGTTPPAWRPARKQPRCTGGRWLTAPGMTGPSPTPRPPAAARWTPGPPSPRSWSPATPSRRWPHWKPRSATTRSTSTSTSGSCACRPRPAAPTRSAARCACWKKARRDRRHARPPDPPGRCRAPGHARAAAGTTTRRPAAARPAALRPGCPPAPARPLPRPVTRTRPARPQPASRPQTRNHGRSRVTINVPPGTQFTARRPPSQLRLPGGGAGRPAILPGFRSAS